MRAPGPAATEQTRTIGQVSLTPRQLEILGELATGASFKEVAHRRGIAIPTVVHHAGNAYRRLGVTSAIEAFVVLGWLHPEEPR